MKYNTEKNEAYIKANVPKGRLEQYKAEVRNKTINEFASELKKHKEFIFDGCVSIYGINEIDEQMKGDKE